MLSIAQILGCACLSTAGHDKGRLYLVVKIIDPEFVLVADGSVRKMNNPKKKRSKHLKFLTSLLDEKQLAKLLEGKLVDNEVHRWLINLRK
ncbi:MAG: KOW domain-containing RNA-binding protein [Firmicutes bacterium]|nr:KOW domain-containing RNA-binding protein [Bacillota bacterium]